MGKQQTHISDKSHVDASNPKHINGEDDFEVEEEEETERVENKKVNMNLSRPMVVVVDLMGIFCSFLIVRTLRTDTPTKIFHSRRDRDTIVLK